MKIWCRNCGFSEKTNADLFVKIIGGAAPVGGFWAWVTYLFAGTGFAMPICIAIVTGGVGMLIYKDAIVKWVTNNSYDCPKCSTKNWDLIKDD